MSPEAAASPVLLDTSAWLLALGRSSSPAVKDKVRQFLDTGRVVMMPVVYLELLGGTRSLEEFRRLKSRLGALPQLPVNPEDWEEAANLAFRLRRDGKTVPYTDILIAAVAIRAQALLVHADRHFDMIAGAAELSSENVL